MKASTHSSIHIFIYNFLYSYLFMRFYHDLAIHVLSIFLSCMLLLIHIFIHVPFIHVHVLIPMLCHLLLISIVLIIYAFHHVFLACAILFLSICLSYIHIIYVFLSCLYLFIYFLYFHHVPTIRLCMTIICSHHIILYSYVPIIHVLSITFYDISDHLLSYLIISYDLYLSYNPIFISFHISCTHLYILHFLYFSLFHAYYI